MSGRYRATYRWREAFFLAPVCGLMIGVMIALADGGTFGPVLSGVWTMFLILALWGYRIRVQRREHLNR